MARAALGLPQPTSVERATVVPRMSAYSAPVQRTRATPLWVTGHNLPRQLFDKRELKYWLCAYVFMPDHVHLIVCPQQKVYDDSEFLKRVKERVSRKAVQYLKQESPDWLTRIRVPRGDKIEHHFWQPGRGHDRNVEHARTLENMIEYIHMNPVRRNLVVNPRDWRWSSAGWFEGCPLNDLRPDPIPREWLEDAR
jgi:putative transposase